MDKKVFILLTGPSGSGKTTVANKLYQKYGMTQIYSYTTRLKRGKDDEEHTFVTDKQFDKLKDIISYTEYNGFRYGITRSQVDNNDIFVVDVPGIRSFLRNYDGDKRVVIICLESSELDIKLRLIKRDGLTKALERIKYDETIKYLPIASKMADITLYNHDANKTAKTIYDFVQMIC